MALFDKCNTSCTVDTTSACPAADVIDNTVGYLCNEPKSVPTLDQYTGEYAGQFVDPINALAASCGGFIPAFDFTCNDKYTQELNGYMFPGIDTSVIDANDNTSQFAAYRSYTSVNQAANYANAFSAAENVHIEEYVCEATGETKCAYAMLWKERTNDDGMIKVTADAAAGDDLVILENTSGMNVGGYLNIIPCSDDTCALHPHISEITAVDHETGEVSFADPLTYDIFAVQAEEDAEGNVVGCGTCETKAFYTLPAVTCGSCIPEGGKLGGGEEVLKKTFFRKYGYLLTMNEKEMRDCLQCAWDFDGDEYGYATGNKVLAQKLGDFKRSMDLTLLSDYFYAPGPGISIANCAPTTGPGAITGVLGADAEGCCALHDLCGKKPIEKGLALLDIMDQIAQCDMGNNNPRIDMIMNQTALTNFKKMTKIWNQLKGVPTCCEPRDGLKDFNETVTVKSYFMDRPYDMKKSDFLSKMYPNTGVIMFVPQGHMLLRTFGEYLGDNFDVINGTNMNFMEIKEVNKDDTDCINCKRSLRVTGSYLVAGVGFCSGKWAMITGF